jgi:hypothetical protein
MSLSFPFLFSTTRHGGGGFLAHTMRWKAHNNLAVDTLAKLACRA